MSICLRKLLLILILGLTTSLIAKSADGFEKYINSNWGTDFWFTVPPALIESGNSNGNFVKIYVNSDVESKVTISVSGKSYSSTAVILPGVSHEFNIEPQIAQPYIKTSLDPVFASDVFKNSGINIKSDNPVTVHVVVKYNSTGEGFLVLPVNVLGSEYIVSSYGDASVYYPVYNSFPSLSGIVAAFDGTEVFFTLGGNNSTVTSSGQKPGETIKKILNKGDVWMLSSKGRDADLSGSKITSSKPVSVISGNHATNIPIINKYNGYMAEMEVPTYTWGKTFHLPHIYGRKFSPVVRIFAKEPGTDISINGFFYRTINQSGGILGEGYIELRLSEISGSKFGTISGNKPIAITLYNSGVEEDGLPEPPGEPFQISITPSENYQNEFYFSMPAQNISQSYNSNYLNIIYQKDGLGNIPVDLMIGKFSNGTYNYKTVASQNILEKVDFAGTNYGLAILKTDATGNYSIKSDSKFTAYMYGFNQGSSYGFPAGLKLQTLGSEDKEPPKITWEIDCNGIVSGVAQDMPDDSKIRSNLAGSVYLSDESQNFTRGEFEPITPGTSSRMQWSLKVIDLQSDAKSSILFWDLAGNFSKAEIFYTATKTELTRRYENYGSFKINDNPEYRDFKITNNSDSSYILNTITLKDGKAGFVLTEMPVLPIILNKGESINFKVIFNPANTGIFMDSIGYGDECRFFYAGLVEATVGSPVIEVSDVYFGDITLDGKATEYSIITNTGVSALVLSDYKLPVSSDFKIVFDKEFSPENPLTLLPDEQLTMAVIFTPQKISDYIDSVLIISDASSRDNVCIIKARSIEPGLVASSYNWGRKRIFRTAYPSGPYSIENETNSIVIQNTGNTDIVINGIEIEGGINPLAFEFNRQIFTNLKIEAGNKFEYKIQFRPTEVGQHQLKIRYLNNFGSSTVTELNGIGTVPKINSQIIDFDTTVVEDYGTSVVRKIEIKNLGYDEWAFADTLNIYDFFTENELKISEKWAYYGSEGFKIDKQVVSFPIKLIPGRSYTLTSGFVPQKQGLSQATFTVISDALDTAFIRLIGYGIEQEMTFIGGTGESCVGFEKVISGIVKNNSPKEINIGAVTIINPEPEFTFMNSSITDGFKLQAGASMNIDILYKPVSTADKQIEVVLVDAKVPSLKKQAVFSGRPIQYPTNIVVSPALQSANIGEVVPQKVMLSSSYDLTGMKLLELEVLISYDDYILKPIPASLKIGRDIDGSFNLFIDENHRKSGEIKFIIKSISGIEITKDAELLSIDFKVFFPNDLSTHSDLSYVITPIDNDCIIVNNNISRININPLCGNEIRLINLGSDKYFLGNVSPNPTSGIFTEINFGVGISAHTELRIFSSIGEEIAVPVNGYLAKGSYSAVLNTVNLNSGAYYYIIKSGPFFETKSFMINK